MNVLETFQMLVIAARHETDVTPLLEPFYALDRYLVDSSEDNAEANSTIVRTRLAAFLAAPTTDEPSLILPLSEPGSRLGIEWLNPPEKGLNFWLAEGSSDKAHSRLQSLYSTRV